MLQAQRGTSTRFRKMRRRIYNNRALYLFVLPVVVYYVVFHYLPIYGVQIAFRDFKITRGFYDSPWVGLKHFQRFFDSYWLPVLIRNTLTLSLLSLALSFPLPIVLALMINELPSERFKKSVQTLTYAPHFISVVVLCGMINIFLSPSSGVVGRMLNVLTGNNTNYLMSDGAFKWIYVLSGIWQETGWSSVIYFAALSKVSPELIEAARVDGAGKLKRMLHINLPVLVPTIVILLILRCGSIISVGYTKVFLLQNSANITGSEVISTYVYKTGLAGAQYSFAAAIDLFNALINCTILILANTFSRRVGETSLW